MSLVRRGLEPRRPAGGIRREGRAEREHKSGRGKKILLTILFVVTTIICAFGWLINKIIAKGALLYIIEECSKAPVNGELGPYMKKAIAQMFSRKS